MTISSKRAEHVCTISMILSVLFFAVCLLLGRWSGFFAVSAVAWLSLASVLIWLVLWIQFHTRSLAEQEKLDMGELAKGQELSSIFQSKGEQAALFAAAQRRLDMLGKWFVPVFSGIIAAYQIVLGLYLLKIVSIGDFAEPKQPLICAAAITAIAFVSFLISRYATGMSAQFQWQALKAGGSILLGIAVLCFALAVGLALAQFKFFVVVDVISWAVPILLVILGVETALNAVLDIYRPRLKEGYSRSAFDSRLLGVINEPGGIFHTLASAIDYQFGFKVSQTWFYKLLEKAVVPLVLFAAVILYLLSCVVIVGPDEEAIIEHFGKPSPVSVSPGLHFKWPWPVDITYKYPTKKVMEISIGFVSKKHEEGERREALLWGKSHHETEELLLVAGESRQAAAGAAPVSLIVAVVPVQYRIKDLYAFNYNNNEPEKLLESICYNELTRYAASARIEVDGKVEMSQSLLGAGRVDARLTLIKRIQEAADEAALGVEIVFLGLQEIHPPSEVAADYQKVVGAVQIKQAVILKAEAERNRTLSTLAGSVEDADKLYSLAAEYKEAEEQNKTEKIESLGTSLDKSFAEAKGDIFTTLRNAQSYAFEKVTFAESTGKSFANRLKAYRAAPAIYLRQQRLSVLEEALDKIRKYVVVADMNDTQVFIIDLKEKLTPDLYDLVGLEESSR
ncbi:MAG: protease modulator HflK [Planctomycetota bacterium]|jgi:regulator of protease activity HflC (stomatin/prohibitin superfamily)